MKTTIVGGGNIGTQIATQCAEKDHEVIVYTSTPGVFGKHLSIVDDHGNVLHEGDIKLATSDPQIAFPEAEFIVVTVPPTQMERIADKVYLYAPSSAIICVVPGNGGSECAFKKCVDRGNIFCGLERVPAIARLLEKGKIVKSTEYRPEFHVAALHKNDVNEFADFISDLFDRPTIAIPNFLNITMTPSNPILHTTRLRTLFSDWHEGIIYDRVPLFYEEWDIPSAELLITCDEEVQAICRSLPQFELQFVKSLRDHYESPTPEAMVNKLSSIEPFKGIKTPMIEKDDGYIPDLHSRYFTSDFSYGLTIIKQIAVFAGVNTPNIDETMSWYNRIAIEKNTFNYANYGITDRKAFDELYLN